MSLYFNVYFFPFWWLITVAILYLKVRRREKCWFVNVYYIKHSLVWVTAHWS